jgi:hypothetical protein
MKNDRIEAGRAGTPRRRPRFRIDRLEERIAPKKGGKGSNNCGDASSADVATACNCNPTSY